MYIYWYIMHFLHIDVYWWTPARAAPPQPGPVSTCIRGFPVITTLAWKICDKIATPQFHFEHLPTPVLNSLHHSQNSESAKNTCTFFGGGARPPQTCLFFCLSRFLNLNIKSQFSFRLLVFSGNDMKRCVLPFFGQPIQTTFVCKLQC